MESRMSQFGDRTTEEILSDALTRGDAALASNGAILRHLLHNDDQSMFTDEIVARVRGMIQHIARQLLRAQIDADQNGDSFALSEAALERLTGILTSNGALLGHVHALALEYRLCDRLQFRLRLDPVMPPMTSELRARGGEGAAGIMHLISAQARFCQDQCDMELPLVELPERLFHSVLIAQQMQAAEPDQNVLAIAHARLRGVYESHTNRHALLLQAVAIARAAEQDLFNVAHAGVSVFLSGLAQATRQVREHVVLAAFDRRMTRLALSLRAAGVPQEKVAVQFACFHPDAAVPREYDMVDAHQAALILAQAPLEVFG